MHDVTRYLYKNKNYPCSLTSAADIKTDQNRVLFKIQHIGIVFSNAL